jgi:hypothetical protein
MLKKKALPTPLGGYSEETQKSCSGMIQIGALDLELDDESFCIWEIVRLFIIFYKLGRFLLFKYCRWNF